MTQIVAERDPSRVANPPEQACFDCARRGQDIGALQSSRGRFRDGEEFAICSTAENEAYR